jgi:5-methylcytosine-specific restriction protein B
MPQLQLIRPLIEELARKSAEINIIASQLHIPRDIKERFGAAWGRDYVVNADHISLKTARTDDAGRTTLVSDSVLIKCANAVQLYDAYNEYKKRAKEIKDAEPDPLTATEWKLLGEDRNDPLPSQLAAKIANKIRALTDLSGEEKKLLNLFMTAEKADREELLGAYKGLSRPDSFTPVAAKAFGMRVDHSGYINDVIDILVENPAITKEILAVKAYQDPARKEEPKEEVQFINEAFRAICEFCKDYDDAGEAWRKDSPRCLEVRRNLAKINAWLRASFTSYEGKTLRVKSSDGATNFPKVPWICILPEAQEVNDGVYVSICFDRRGRGAVAGFAESATNPKGLPVERRTSDAIKIDVNGPSSGTRFNDGFVNPEEFYTDSFDSNKLRDHITKSLDLCLQHLGGNQDMPITPEDKANFVAALQKSGFVTENGLPSAFLHALITKPFVILTGNSGTGKTKIAELLVAWLHGDSRAGHELVPVGADWTDNRHVLGFVNYLRPEIDVKSPVYQSTAVLDLILRATESPSLPFFLILDEMNLSHVERYFADFLSAMESRGGVIRLHSEGPPDEENFRLPRFDDDSAGVPRVVAYPNNLFVVGTVNVDETTYMFSPKVLDRAHVIEFQAGSDSIEKFLADPQALQAIEPTSERVSTGFLALSKAARGIGTSLVDPLPPTVAEAINKHLKSILVILCRGRFEFAFRTVKELNSYLRVCRQLAKDKDSWDSGIKLSKKDRDEGRANWLSDLDDEILQKVLPRLHGSRSRMGSLVGALVCYFATGKEADALKFFPDDGKEEAAKTLTDAIILAPIEPEFLRSFKKMQTMARVLVEEQFVSFIC